MQPHPIRSSSCFVVVKFLWLLSGAKPKSNNSCATKETPKPHRPHKPDRRSTRYDPDSLLHDSETRTNKKLQLPRPPETDEIPIRWPIARVRGRRQVVLHRASGSDSGGLWIEQFIQLPPHARRATRQRWEGHAPPRLRPRPNSSRVQRCRRQRSLQLHRVEREHVQHTHSTAPGTPHSMPAF